jgi:hypothetical protein
MVGTPFHESRSLEKASEAAARRRKPSITKYSILPSGRLSPFLRQSSRTVE